MLVRALKNAAGPISFQSGQEFEINNADAPALLADGAVVEITGPGGTVKAQPQFVSGKKVESNVRLDEPKRTVPGDPLEKTPGKVLP